MDDLALVQIAGCAPRPPSDRQCSTTLREIGSSVLSASCWLKRRLRALELTVVNAGRKLTLWHRVGSRAIGGQFSAGGDTLTA